VKTINRREIIENCIVRGALIAGVPMSASRLFALWQRAETDARKATPAEVLGPFYKKGAPNVSDLRVKGDPGFPLRVGGKVMNTRGELLPGARVELWHADHHGHYDVAGFRYRTKLDIGNSGDYAVETVMPGHYPDRPAQHIHYLITAPGHKPLITQLYFETDPYFDGNPGKNYAKGGIVSNRESVRPVTLYEQGTPRAAVTFDIILEKA
jgi:protocatechuate 3,4-dioxygenase beta subunit